MNDVARQMMERIASGLKRKSLTTCSRWSEACRVMGNPFPGPFSFKWHPWLKEMHDSDAEFNVGMKSAQAGYTETALNRVFFMIDVKAIDCLYVLPTMNPDASVFSASRFNPAIELSAHIAKMFSDVDNLGHKRAGNVNLYIRGSRARNQLKSVPTGMIVLDEVDEMDQQNIPLALERASGQLTRQVWAISTPTIPKFGIHKMFLDTTQEHFYFRCPCCSKYTELVFPDCLEITAEDVNDPDVEKSFYKCKECKNRLEHATKYKWLAGGEWQAQAKGHLGRGFHVNQLYSSAQAGRPAEIAKSYLRSLRDPSEEQELFNSKFGMPHIVAGAGVTDLDIIENTGEHRRYEQAPRENSPITMGVDVGKWLHVEIDQWFLSGVTNSVDLNVTAKAKVLTMLKVRDFEELDILLRQFGVTACVIDINPERRKAYEFACRFNGLVKLCMYVQGVSGKQIHMGNENDPEHTIKVDRTSWLDLSLGRFKQRGMIKIPLDTTMEYKDQIKAPVRVYEKDTNGNPVGRYVTANDEDHYAHARNYAEIALQFALSWANPSDIVE